MYINTAYNNKNNRSTRTQEYIRILAQKLINTETVRISDRNNEKNSNGQNRKKKAEQKRKNARRKLQK